jgi:CBS domain-containing protein
MTSLGKTTLPSGIAFAQASAYRLRKGSVSMKISEIMTSTVRSLQPESSVQEAAQLMKDYEIGALPICDNGRIVGIVTDRDITIRGVAAGLDAGKTPIRRVMSTNVAYCFDNDDVDDVVRIMEAQQVRRLPILNASLQLAGIVTLGDVAVRTKNSDIAGETLQQISLPT